jgi:hypothetical protein
MRSVRIILVGSLCILSGITTVTHAQTGPPAPGRPGLAPPSTAQTFTLRDIDGVRNEGGGRFTITDPRPLERTAELLERKLQVAISYEEPAWSSAGDLSNAADLPQNSVLASKNPAWRGPLVPRSSTVDVTIPATGATVAAIIQAALDNHRLRGNPGEFKAVQLGDGGFSIVAERVDDQNGGIVTSVSPLDLRITMPEEERTMADTLAVLIRAINATSKIPVVRPTIGGKGHFDIVRVRVGAQNEPARDVLSRILRVPGQPKFSWTLDYMPDLRTYVLGFRRIQVERVLGDGSTELVEILWPKQ